MAGRVYKNCKVLTGGYDISGDLNQMAVDYAFDEVPMPPVMTDACRHSLPGFPKLAWNVRGRVQSADAPLGIEDILYARLGSVTAVPMTFAPTTGAVGEPVYFGETTLLKYSPGAAIGEAYLFQASGAGRGSKLVRGIAMEASQKTSTGTGTARELGAISATQYLYGVLHITAKEGTNPTVDVIVESDDAQAFSTPITRATFTQKTVIGAQFILPVVGPVTDTWWRLKWTIGGTGSPKFTIYGAVGIL